MRELRRDNFGLLIAYLLPGSVALWGLSYHVEAVRPWLQAAPKEAPSIGGFLYATLASTALGLVVSAVRWATVDRALARAGVRQPSWDFELFAERLPAYEWLVANHYRYYQFYSNLLVALAGAYAARLLAAPGPWKQELLLVAAFAMTEAVLLAGAKDTLRKYYTRTEALLARGRRKRAEASRAKERIRSSRRGGPVAPTGSPGPEDRSEASCLASGRPPGETDHPPARPASRDAGVAGPSHRRLGKVESPGGEGPTNG